MNRLSPEESEFQTYVEQMIAHQGDLRAFIYSLLPNSPSVDDVLQNTNMVLWKKRHQFEGGTNFHAWAFKIARYQVMHQFDRFKRDQRLVFSEAVMDQIRDASITEEAPNATRVALEECVSQLTEKQREIVAARYTAGASLQKLAKQLECSAVSLRVSLHRIRAALKTCIETKLSGELR